MKKRILAASLAVLALTACAPTTPTPSEEARRCLTDSLNLVPRDKIRRAGATSQEGGVTRGYVKGTRLKLSGRVRAAQLQLPMHAPGRYKTKGEHNEDF